AWPEPLVVVHRQVEQDVLVDKGRAERLRLDRPEDAQHFAAYVCHEASENASSARSAMARPIAIEEVAAGEGALRTWKMRSDVWTMKSSTSPPSEPSACARTP